MTIGNLRKGFVARLSVSLTMAGLEILKNQNLRGTLLLLEACKLATTAHAKVEQ
jgi:hypothetical protein